jgi:ribosomal protein L4
MVEHVFTTRPRNYSQDLNRKVKKVARRSALVDKLLNNKVIIVKILPLMHQRLKN